MDNTIVKLDVIKGEEAILHHLVYLDHILQIVVNQAHDFFNFIIILIHNTIINVTKPLIINIIPPANNTYF